MIIDLVDILMLNNPYKYICNVFFEFMLCDYKYIFKLKLVIIEFLYNFVNFFFLPDFKITFCM